MVASSIFAVFKSSSSFYQVLFHWSVNTVSIAINVEHRDKLSKLKETFSISEVFKYFTFGQGALHYIHQENL